MLNRQQAITQTNYDQVLWLHITSLGQRPGWVGIQYRIRHLIVRFCKDSMVQDRVVKCSYHFEILQVSQQHRCWGTRQISEQLDNSNSGVFEDLQDLTIRPKKILHSSLCSLLVLWLEYFMRSKLTPWLTMSWLLALPGLQQQWYWLDIHRINGSLFSTRKDFNSLCHHWQMIVSYVRFPEKIMIIIRKQTGYVSILGKVVENIPCDESAILIYESMN